jgi:hypothetical protein
VHYATQITDQQIASDEALIATLLFHLTSSHARAVERAQLGLGGSRRAEDAEPSRELLEAVSNVRERLHTLRRCLVSPIGRDLAALSADTPRSPHGDALLDHLREHDGPTHNLD